MTPTWKNYMWARGHAVRKARPGGSRIRVSRCGRAEILLPSWDCPESPPPDACSLCIKKLGYRKADGLVVVRRRA